MTMSAAAITIRQQISPRPGNPHATDARSLSYTQGSLFSFSLHATAYESDAATIRIPAGVKLHLHSVSVDLKEMAEFIKNSGARGVSLKFSSEENGMMMGIWTYDKERSGDVWETGLGVEVEGPRTIRLAAVTDRGIKHGSALNVNVFGSVRKGDL
ncbi:hypothetical protein ACHAWU_007756 [Discostella pseudostelligera]|uniref:Uncharacterized protein n=1 Tax=Discostella pseudostelligera TaxID=259834 RepID=A0ABD3MRB7_9STRA